MTMTPRIFVAGTDTDIGKTFVSALLVKKWGFDYWKPIQTGLSEDQGDTKTVQELLQKSGAVPETSTIFEPSLTYMKPLSPCMEMYGFREGKQHSSRKSKIACFPRWKKI